MRRFLGFLAFMLTASLAFATDRPSSPQSIEQSYGQNYKDMVLATCVANAYKGDKDAATDAGSSVSALRDWTYYDLEKSPDEVKALVNSYLNRNYKNPLVEAEIKGVRFDFLKCLDLYHSKELDSLAKKVVINPGHTYKQDNP
ncbi:type VI secretion system amidase immunity protein Tai4 [Pseudomonas huanghezhanensis]|uniref:type VI secretion system amidase immunity protein Tai4 n=1 Tax=Pseudomonas huanghezhanensis TaxID=3002903 RepID=UPI0022866806|nr:type VI secretion system amidase immunity protein Tai4 [Pseudomonas sp. BSw22131]